MPPLHPRRATPTFACAVALVAVAALVGCAPLHARPTPGEATRPDPVAPPDSAAASAEPRIDDAEPPASEATPSTTAPEPQVLLVEASAYNSHRGQTDSTPNRGAWGDRLQPGMKVIAVSRDLLERGLVRGQRVRIRGLEGEYVVLDRMPSRWQQKIDIYMGTDVRAARQWGVREVEIEWVPSIDPPGEVASD